MSDANNRLDPATVAKEVANALEQEENATPTGISHITGYDSRTVRKYVNLLEEFGLARCVEVPLGLSGARKMRVCSLTGAYFELSGKRRRDVEER